MTYSVYKIGNKANSRYFVIYIDPNIGRDFVFLTSDYWQCPVILILQTYSECRPVVDWYINYLA